MKELVAAVFIAIGLAIALWPSTKAEAGDQDDEPPSTHVAGPYGPFYEPKSPEPSISTPISWGGSHPNVVGDPPSPDEVRGLIAHYAQTFGIDVGLAEKIAECESGDRWDARNPGSSATGVYQIIDATARAWGVTDVLDAEENIRAAIYQMSVQGTGPWESSKHCWSK